MKIVQLRDADYYGKLNSILDELWEFKYIRGWDQGQLAVAAGLNQATISRLERRKTRYPRFDTVWRIAKALGVELQIIGRKLRSVAGGK